MQNMPMGKDREVYTQSIAFHLEGLEKSFKKKKRAVFTMAVAVKQLFLLL